MIVYAPRRVTLAPHEPQSIRIAARPPQGLPDGEYRVHLLFRAIPPATPVVPASARAAQGPAPAAHPDLWRDHPGHRPARQSPGDRRHRQCPAREEATASRRSGSTSAARAPAPPSARSGCYKAGVKDPIAVQKGGRGLHRARLAPRRDPDRREAYKGAVDGPVTVQYFETFEDGNEKLAETQAVLR